MPIDPNELAKIAVQDDPHRALYMLIIFALAAAVVMLYMRNQGLSDRILDALVKGAEMNTSVKTSNEQLARSVDELSRRIERLTNV